LSEVGALRLGGFLFLCAASSPAWADEADSSSSAAAANADTPDFVPDAEPESRAVERFRVPLDPKRIFVASPKEAGSTRVWIVSFVDERCAPCLDHIAQLKAFPARHKNKWPVEIQIRRLPVIAGASPKGAFDETDLRVARTFGVSSVPTFFVNGRRFSGLQSDEVVDSIVSAEIAAASQVAAKQANARDLYAVLTKDAKAQASAPSRPRFDDVKATELRPGASPTRGAAGAPVLVTVFSDLYCPHGAEHAATLKKLLDEYGGKIRVVFKHRPVTVFGASRTAACAAIAAQEQAKFWEMHDKIVVGLAPGHALEDGESAGEQQIPKRLLGYAAEIKLDIDAFRLVMEGERCQKEIDDDLALAAKLGVTGTPTTFVNGRRVVGAAPIGVLRSLIEDELKKAKGK
jgi:protein-disulfide isomerase